MSQKPKSPHGFLRLFLGANPNSYDLLQNKFFSFETEIFRLVQVKLGLGLRLRLGRLG